MKRNWCWVATSESVSSPSLGSSRSKCWKTKSISYCNMLYIGSLFGIYNKKYISYIYIYLHLHKNQPNVGKYAIITGSYGYCNSPVPIHAMIQFKQFQFKTIHDKCSTMILKVLQFHFEMVFQHVAEYFNDSIWHLMLT